MNNNILTPKSTEEFFQENIKFKYPLSELNFQKDLLELFDENIIEKYMILPYKVIDNTLIVISSIANMNKTRDLTIAIKNVLNNNDKKWQIKLVYTDNNAELKRTITKNFNFTFGYVTTNS